MNNGKKETTKEEYKVNYIFDKNSKTNVNEILKKSFILSLKAEGKIMEENCALAEAKLPTHICAKSLCDYCTDQCKLTLLFMELLTKLVIP